MLTKKEIKENKDQILTHLLNIDCFRTNKAIEVNEVIKVHRFNTFKGYAHFEWNRFGFHLLWEHDINDSEGLNTWDEPTDHDLLFHSFEKLTKAEKNKFQHFLI